MRRHRVFLTVFCIMLCWSFSAYASPFVDNGNGTVTDNKTGLVWQQGEPGQMTWDAALSYCEGLPLGGHSDWRLPNIKELESITDDTRWNPAIDTTYFPNAYASYYWSSTAGAYYPGYAWYVYFYVGNVNYGSKYYSMYVRCVRGGQSGSLGNFDHFEFSSIASPKTVGAPGFSVTITKKDAYENVMNYTGPVALWSNSGSVYPMSINMNNGTWTGPVTLYAAGLGSYLGASTSDAYGTSNSFTVVGSGGGVADFGNLYVKVYDNRGNPLSGADISLDLNNDGTIEYTHSTNSNGEYQFTHLPSGVYLVKAEFGLQSESDNTYVPANSLPATVYLTVPIFPSCKTPVILLPGIMGSNSKGKYIIYPQLPEKYPAEVSDLVLHGRKTAGWEDLIDDYLTKNGYEEGKSIIECPYDWRMPAKQVAEWYLKPCIDRAKKATGSEKVNIISHSTGGLVTRAYIQSDSYSDRNDIYRFAMVGTPNRGAVNAYYLWEGGDPLWADNLNESLLGHISPFGPNFYWNTTERMYERTYKKGNLDPDEHIKIWNFIHGKAPELKDLLPVFDFLEYGSLSHITSDANKNKTLIDLNNDSKRFERMSQFGDSGTVETHVFYSKSEDTIRSHKIYNPDFHSPSSPLYEDGVPQIYAKPAKSPGDNTVWEGSAKLPCDEGWAYCVDYISSEHVSLIKNYAQQLFNFVNDGEPTCQSQSVARMAANATEAAVNTISLVIDGRAQPYIVDPNTAGTGADPSTGLVANNIPLSITNLQAERANISIENPVDGTYTLYLKSAYDQDHYLTLDYIDSLEVKSLQFHGFNHATTTSFTFTVDSASTDKITVNQTPLPPTGLQADAINYDPFGLTTKLTWTYSESPDVVTYRVYSKMIDEPYFYLVTEMSVNTISLLYPWAADSTIKTRIFTVSAVKADGAESFLSNMVQNDDRDHDGLIDEQETAIGTNLDNPDSDADGLKDGEEYTRGTNPLLTDTDSDGFTDKEEVIAGSDPLDLSSLPAFSADVPSGFWAENYIYAIYNAGITTGCSQNPLNYCPSNNVTRQAMAAFIIRSLYGENFMYPTTPYFTDVPDTHQFFKYIQKMREMNITTGCTAAEYCPGNNVTRQAMAAFIIRAKLGETFSYTSAPYFTDVPNTNQFFKYVQKMKDESITTGCSATEYCPSNNVNRASMAAFLARAFLGMP